MKSIALFSVLALSGAFAQAESSAATTIASTLCVSPEFKCRAMVQAETEARAFLLDETAPIGTRLQLAMNAVRMENPDTAFTLKQLAQIVLEETQKYSGQQ